MPRAALMPPYRSEAKRRMDCLNMSNAYLGSDCVGAGGEELRDACRAESLLSQAEGGAEAGATSADNDSVVCVVHKRIRAA